MAMRKHLRKSQDGKLNSQNRDSIITKSESIFGNNKVLHTDQTDEQTNKEGLINMINE